MVTANGQTSETGKNTPPANMTTQNENDKNNDIDNNKDNLEAGGFALLLEVSHPKVYNQHYGVPGKSQELRISYQRRSLW